MFSKLGICFKTDSPSITNGNAVMLDQSKRELELDSMDFV